MCRSLVDHPSDEKIDGMLILRSEGLTELEEELRESGIILWFTTLNSTVFELIERAPLGTTMGHQRMFFDLPSAVEHYGKTRDAISD